MVRVAWNKGLTKETSESVRKYSISAGKTNREYWTSYLQDKLTKMYGYNYLSNNVVLNIL